MNECVNACMRSGFVAVTGRANMGKSTFINQVLGKKVAIVSPKPQTTRNRLLGVYHRQGVQIIFVDTPGIHNSQSPLNQAMVKTAYASSQDVDVLLYFIDARRGMIEEDWAILKKLDPPQGRCFIVMNKVDLVGDRRPLLPRMAAMAAGPIAIDAVYPVSSQNGEGVDHLLAGIQGLLPEGPAYFPATQLSDQSDSFMAGEIIREKLFVLLQEELPYAIAVEVEKFNASKKNIEIAAIIYVARDSQKGMVIGQRGEMLKRVGSAARREMEQLFGRHVQLALWVRLHKNWTDDPAALRELGYISE